MKEIISKTELAEFFRDKLLPYYEKHYREDLTMLDANGLSLDTGLCKCAKREFSVFIYRIMMGMDIDCTYLFPEVMYNGYSAKESLLPRIEWMKNFIKDNK